MGENLFFASFPQSQAQSVWGISVLWEWDLEFREVESENYDSCHHRKVGILLYAYNNYIIIAYILYFVNIAYLRDGKNEEKNCEKYKQQEQGAPVQKTLSTVKRCIYMVVYFHFYWWWHTCKKREIAEIYLRKFFWIFCKILGREREINTAPKPSPEVAPSKMEVAPF